MVSILTPITDTTPPKMFEECIKSVIGLKDIDYEWMIQHDGETEFLKDKLLKLNELPQIKVDFNKRTFGTAVTRNSAFARSSGDWVVGLDADDYLVGSGFSSIVKKLPSNYDWVTGQVSHLIDSKEVPRKCGLPSGHIDIDQIDEARKANGGHMPLVAASVFIRSSFLWQLGGWPAVPRSEDANLLFAINGIRPGLLFDDLFYVYRKWPGQTTESEWIKEPKTIQISLTQRFRWRDALKESENS